MSKDGNMKHIWMYWDRPVETMPEYMKLCMRTMVRHKGSLQLNVLDQYSINRYLPDLRPEWHRLKKAAHKADYIRTRLGYKYGGMWVDCDMVALSDIQVLFDFPDSYDYACQDIGTSIGCFVARRGCELLKKVMHAQDIVLDKHRSEIQWNEIGNKLMAECGREYRYYQWPQWTVDEIASGKVSKLLSTEETLEDNVDRNAVIFHMCNSCVGPLIREQVRDGRLLTSDRLVSKLFRRALGLGETPETLRNINLGDVVWTLAKPVRRVRKVFAGERP